jgi:hypothetical protein
LLTSQIIHIFLLGDDSLGHSFRLSDWRSLYFSFNICNWPSIILFGYVNLCSIIISFEHLQMFINCFILFVWDSSLFSTAVRQLNDGQFGLSFSCAFNFTDGKVFWFVLHIN